MGYITNIGGCHDEGYHVVSIGIHMYLYIIKYSKLNMNVPESIGWTYPQRVALPWEPL